MGIWDHTGDNGGSVICPGCCSWRGWFGMKFELNLFQKVYGKEKTNKVALRHASTFILFLVIAIMTTFGVDDLITATSIMMVLVLCEIVYGCYTLLSLRLRKLEEKEEDIERRLKKKQEK